jgi:hypothetical protein
MLEIAKATPEFWGGFLTLTATPTGRVAREKRFVLWKANGVKTKVNRYWCKLIR